MASTESSDRASSRPRSEQARDARARAWRFVFNCYEKQKAPEPDSCNDAAIVRSTEEVSDVEQRPDGPSEIVVTYSRKLRNQ